MLCNFNYHSCKLFMVRFILDQSKFLLAFCSNNHHEYIIKHHYLARIHGISFIRQNLLKSLKVIQLI